MKQILDYLVDMLPYLLLALPLVILSRVILRYGVFVRRGIETTARHEIGVGVFALFLVGLASQTVIPKLEFGVGGVGFVNGALRGEINLIPGMVFIDCWRECVVGGHWTYFWINVIGNLALFLPIGFFLPLLWSRVSLRKTLLIGLGISALIELCQLPQARGTDLDDLWINTLGVLLGYAVFSALSRRRLLHPEAFRMRGPAPDSGQ